MAAVDADLLGQVVQPWLRVAGRSDWPQGLFALAHAAVALGCVAAASRFEGPRARALVAVAVLLIALALIDLFRADALLVLMARHVARLQGWYDARRSWQGAALVLALSLGFVVACGRHPIGWSTGLGRVLTGAAALVALLVLRLVSLHHTDPLLDARLAGVSVGRWVAVLGLCLVASGSRRVAEGE
jgi:hypothetical protein